MVDLLKRWLTFDAQNIIPEVWQALAVLWVALLIFSFTSVATLEISAAGKFFWLLIIICLPLLGLFLYCIRCLVRADYHQLEFLFFRRRNSKPKPHPRHMAGDFR